MKRTHHRPVPTIALLWAIAACDGGPAPPAEPTVVDFRGHAHPELIAHSGEFEKKVYQVADRVHQAVGFGLANSILIEGEDGVIVVDVLGSVERAAEVRAEFEKISDKPIAALIYTHNHADHVFGGRGFVPDGEVDVYAHETTNHFIDRTVSVVRPIISSRAARMFGTHLPSGPDGLVNAGIGPFLEIGEPGNTPGLIRPNRSFRERMELEIAGVRLELVHAPGETNDQLFVWLPDRKVLLPGDNVYKAFPNLYTIRGTPYRDVLEWSRSIDRMRELRPEHLAPSHGRPIHGAREVADVLTAYRDAIQFVHDQTVRGINRGLGPDQLVEVVKLPPHLRDHPYLKEFYGTVEWSVRSIFAGYLGWFDGDTATLSPVSPEERAGGVLELAGGSEALLRAVRSALEAKRYRWAAELATHLIRAQPELEEARQLKAQALRVLGRRSISPNGRNYFLTQALELEGEVVVEQGPIDESVLSVAYEIPIGQFMAAMPSRLDPEKSADTDTRVGFRFPDVDEGYGLHVRRGVAEFRRSFPQDPDIAVTVSSKTWKEIAMGLRNPAVELAVGDLEVEGGRLALAGFLNLFR